MILSLLEGFSQLISLGYEKRNDDDFYDRLSRKYTAIFMIMWSIIVCTKQLVGTSVKCWYIFSLTFEKISHLSHMVYKKRCSKEFKGSKCDFATGTCYITNFYTPSSNYSTQLESRDNLLAHKISYYQWVPFMFAALALLSYVPYLCW